MASSEMQSAAEVSQGSTFRRLMAQLAERQAWEKANDVQALCDCHGQTLTAAWREALQEDDERQRAREAAAARARLEVHLPSKLREAGVGELHINGLSLRLQPRAALDAARRWLEQPVPRRFPFLLMMEETNTGKTQAVAWLLAELMRRYPWNSQATGTILRRPFIFIRSVQFSEVNFFSDTGRAWLEDLRECPVLAVDDLGTERLNEEAMTRLYGVLDARYMDRRATILSTNLKQRRRDWKVPLAQSAEQPAWADRFDERFTRRVRELAIVLSNGKVRMGEEVAS
jgi:DNA replication protein DnaC